MAANVQEIMTFGNRSTMALPQLKEPTGRTAQVFPFPESLHEAEEMDTGRKDGLGCAMAIRLMILLEIGAGLAAYGIWRYFH